MATCLSTRPADGGGSSAAASFLLASARPLNHISLCSGLHTFWKNGLGEVAHWLRRHKPEVLHLLGQQVEVVRDALEATGGLGVEVRQDRGRQDDGRAERDESGGKKHCACMWVGEKEKARWLINLGRLVNCFRDSWLEREDISDISLALSCCRWTDHCEIDARTADQQARKQTSTCGYMQSLKL